MAWKDEAFTLWQMWGRIYEDDSKSHEFIKGITSSWYLVNVVDNDYRDGNARIFQLFSDK